MDEPVTVAVVVVQSLLILVGLGVLVRFWIHAGRRRVRWDARAHRLSLRPLPGRDVLILVAMVFGLVSLTVSCLRAAGMTEEDLASPRGLIYQSLALHWAVILMVFLLLKARGRRWRRVFGMHPGRLGGDLRRGIVGYFAMTPVVAVFGIVYRVMLQTLGIELDVQEVARVLIGDAPLPARIYLVLLGVCIGPVAEELLFRGMLFPVLARRLGPFASLLAVSLIFGLIHGHLPSFLPLFVVSVSFCLGYIYTGSLAVPMVMHMVFNAVNLVLFAALQGAG